MDKFSNRDNNMKQCLLIIVSLLFCACRADKPIAIYAINMMYACECPRYRIFMIEDVKSRLIDSEIDLDKNEALSKEIWRVIQLESHKKGSLIGMDLDLEFESLEKEREFSKKEGISPICNIYYFKGVLRQGLFGKVVLYVKDYKITPKSKTCISKEIKGHNTKYYKD